MVTRDNYHLVPDDLKASYPDLDIIHLLVDTQYDLLKSGISLAWQEDSGQDYARIEF